ncbi:type II toxin-antitoxin system RelE/ParE family toxin [bacterium]|nr:type II toxin-antitoxin system RelE/ParE family toxin [bacterium]
MVKYEIRIKHSAIKELDRIHTKQQRQRIIKRIQDLADDPYPAGFRKLSGMEKFRIRVGSNRILYTIKNEKLVIHVIRIAHRKDVYR